MKRSTNIFGTIRNPVANSTSISGAQENNAASTTGVKTVEVDWLERA